MNDRSSPIHALPRTPERVRAHRIAYWSATIVSAGAFLAPGIANLVHAPHVASDMAHLGYPSYFLGILGTWKVLGSVAIVAPRMPRLKEWAYAGMLFDLTGAAASRLSAGDGAVTIVVPLLLAIVVLMSWALRPPERRLPAPRPEGRGGLHEAAR